MPIAVTDAAYAYLTDAGIRGAIMQTILYDDRSAKSALYLPWNEARALSRARAMAEMARQDVVELLFATWEETWGCKGSRLGVELDFEREQLSFIYNDIIAEMEIIRHYKLTNQPGLFISYSVQIDLEDDQVRLAAYSNTKGKNCQNWPSIDGWRRQAASTGIEEGVVSDTAIPFVDLRSSIAERLALMTHNAESLVQAVEAGVLSSQTPKHL